MNRPSRPAAAGSAPQGYERSTRGDGRHGHAACTGSHRPHRSSRDCRCASPPPRAPPPFRRSGGPPLRDRHAATRSTSRPATSFETERRRSRASAARPDRTRVSPPRVSARRATAPRASSATRLQMLRRARRRRGARQREEVSWRRRPAAQVAYTRLRPQGRTPSPERRSRTAASGFRSQSRPGKRAFQPQNPLRFACIRRRYFPKPLQSRCTATSYAAAGAGQSRRRGISSSWTTLEAHELSASRPAGSEHGHRSAEAWSAEAARVAGIVSVSRQRSRSARARDRFPLG